MANATVIFEPGNYAALSKLLKGMPEKLASGVVDKSLRGAANLMRDEARRLVPVGSKDKKGKYPHSAGDLRRSLRVDVGKTREPGEYKILFIAGAGSGWANIYYPWFVEFGHKATKATAGQRRLMKAKRQGIPEQIQAAKGGVRNAKSHRSRRRARSRLRFLLNVQAGNIKDSRADVAPRPFFRPAFDNKKGEAQEFINGELINALNSDWGRLSA